MANHGNVRPIEKRLMNQRAIDAMNREAVKDDNFDLIVVCIYDDKQSKFVPTIACDVRCPECGCRYTDVYRGMRKMWWDDDHANPGHPMLVCACGEQFTTQLED